VEQEFWTRYSQFGLDFSTITSYTGLGVLGYGGERATFFVKRGLLYSGHYKN
jgi:hypothetical protein